ncbi:glycine--tRNA ligase [Candidatus Babeliales bacterium]|nr:glycine--tRNA ligase [Candidatus Babeliales bacterium]
MPSDTKLTLDALVSFCKRRGFVYQSSDIYGGLNGVYDFGHLGTLMKRNIRDLWIQSLRNKKGEIVQLEGSLLGPEAVWEASVHVPGFHDPMVDCKECKKRFRADEFDLKKGCPSCGKNNWTDIREFNMMFKTQLGAMENASSTAYLRPETAQAIFINFKNVLSTSRVKIPFGIAQMGKAFRNEITPKQFLFRMREFEQMEIEWFCKGSEAPEDLAFWIEHRLLFYKTLGINPDKIRIREHESDELAHYSTSCVDVEYEFPFGWKELEGIAHRGNFDLTQHSKHSGKDLNVFDEETRESYIPHVVEASVGTDRLFLTLLFDAYHEDEIENETRVVLKLHPAIAPIKIAFMPLTKKLEEPTKALYEFYAQKGISVQYDVSGSIGKRYRRQDEIGTPFCITYDFESEQDNCVTIRNRDTTLQERIAIEKLPEYLGI